MYMFPFFIECSKYYQKDPYKQKFLQKLAFGHGIHIIKRKDKNILVTANGEFVIPKTYSEKTRIELESKLWQVNEFTKLGECIKETRSTWHTARKKDKMYLIYKYVAALPNMTTSEKMIISNILILALLLKLIKPVDIEYANSKIVNINERLTQKETYTQMNFVYDYSIPHSSKLYETFNTYTLDEEDE
jgi:hypothetical protein